MKSSLKRILEFFSGRILRSKFFKAQKNKVVILMYHGIVPRAPDLPDWCLVTEKDFEDQIAILQKNFDILPLREAITKLNKGTIKKPTAVITFDDGYLNNYTNALPILEKFGAPATIFLTTNFIDSPSTIWTGRLQEIFATTQHKNLTWKGQHYDLRSTGAKVTTLQQIKRSLKKMNLRTIEEEVTALSNSLLNRPLDSLSPESPYRMLTSTMISEMQNSPLIEFGAHTHNHPILSRLSKEQQSYEIATSLDKIRSTTGPRVPLFAFPNGSFEDYTDETLEILSANGVEICLTTVEGVCQKGDSNLELMRYGVGNNASFNRELLTMFLSRTKQPRHTDE